MNKNTEQRVGVTIQPLAGAPGAPGATPNYLEEFPAEADNATTKYNDKNAIWDSGNEMNRYKHVSFAGNGGGFQLRADTAFTQSPAGAPGRPKKNDISIRVKNLNKPDYFPWERLYHTGNLDPSKFLTTANLSAKADKTYVDSALASKLDASDISSKAEISYVDNQDKALSNRINSVEQSLKGKDIVYVISAGRVDANGSVARNKGKGAIGIKMGQGIYRLSVTGLPNSYGVNITILNSTNLTASISNATSSDFTVNIVTANGAVSANSEFYFQVFEL